MAEPRTYHQFKKIVRATAEKGSADIILANVKDDKQMKDLINLYEMQKATDTFDRVEYADLLREVADPLGQTWNMSGKSGSQGPLQPQDKKEVGRDEIDKLINEVQSEPKKKKKKISAEKLLGEKPKSRSGAISPDKLIPPDKKGGVGSESSTTKQKKLIGTPVEQLAANLNVIAKELAGINTILVRQLKGQEKNAKQLADAARKEERDKKEEDSESIVKKIGTGVVDAVKKPFKSFFERVLDFFKNIALGAAVLGIIDWLKKPDNQQRIENFTNFIIDSLPFILGGIGAILALKIGSKILKVLNLLYKLGTAFINMGRRAAKFAKKIIDRLRGKKPKPKLKPNTSGIQGRGSVGTNPGFKDPSRYRAPGQARASGFRLEQLRGQATGTSATATPYKNFLKGFKGGIASLGLGYLLQTGADKFILNPAQDKMAEMRAKNLAESDEDTQVQIIENMLAKIDSELEFQKTSAHLLQKGLVLGGETQSETNVKMLSKILAKYMEITKKKKLPGQEDETDDNLNFNMNLGRGELDALASEVNVVEGNNSSAYKRGGSEQIDAMSGYNALMTGGIIKTDFSGTFKDDMGKETPKVQLKGLDGGSVISSPSMFSADRKMLYDIPSPKLLSETIVLPPVGPDGGTTNAAGGFASGGRNEAPSFSPFDVNNPTLLPVLATLNAQP